MKIIKKHTSKKFDTNDPKSIIFHIDLGTEAGTINEIFNTSNPVSYNYYITTSGEIYEFVPYKYGSWHAGRKLKPIKRARDFFGDINPNKKSIGICYEGSTATTKATSLQVQSCAWLIMNKLPTVEEYFTHKDTAIDKSIVVKDFQNRVLKFIKDSGVSQPTPEPSAICKILGTLSAKYGCK
jgi:N-acetyl-anhydromuramyl-L-alanine amidase AmpD